MSYKEIKKESKQIYKSDFGRCCGIGFVAFAIKLALFLIIATVQFICIQSYGNSFMYGLPSVLFWFLYALSYVFVVLPINTGLGTYFAKICGGVNSRIDNIFAHFTKFGTDVTAKLLVSLTVLAEIAAANLISFAAYEILKTAGMQAYSVPMFAVGAIIFVAAAAVVIYTLTAFSPVTYVIEKYPGISATAIYKKAFGITRKARGKLFGLCCSFAGYILLSLLTLGIGFIWLNPYINISTKLFYDKIERGF